MQPRQSSCRDLTAGQQLELDPLAIERFAQHLRRLQHARWIEVVRAIYVWSRHQRPGPCGDRAASDRERPLDRLGAVVEPRQDVGVQVDHTLNATPPGAGLPRLPGRPALAPPQRQGRRCGRVVADECGHRRGAYGLLLSRLSHRGGVGALGGLVGLQSTAVAFAFGRAAGRLLVACLEQVDVAQTAPVFGAHRGDARFQRARGFAVGHALVEAEVFLQAAAVVAGDAELGRVDRDRRGRAVRFRARPRAG